MKKALMLLAVTALALSCVPVFSQTARSDPKDAFAKTVPIVKIYSHNLGYKVLYFTSQYELAEMYVPMKWFAPGVEHAQIVWGNGPSFPCFSIIWADGKFDHVRLYLVDNFSSKTWAVLDDKGKDLSALFNVEGPPLQF